MSIRHKWRVRTKEYESEAKKIPKAGAERTPRTKETGRRSRGTNREDKRETERDASELSASTPKINK